LTNSVNLETLKINNCDIENTITLPKLIKKLIYINDIYSGSYSSFITDFPPELKCIHIRGKWNIFQQDLSNNITNLFLDNSIINFNFIDTLHNLTYLSIRNTQNKFCLDEAIINRLCSNIEHLVITGDGRLHLIQLPLSLLTLTIKRSYINETITLPSNLIKLYIDGCFNRDIIFANKITHITLIGSFNCKIKAFPPNLKSLELGNMFNQPIESLPQSLEYLSLGKRFNQNIKDLIETLPMLKKVQILNENYIYRDVINYLCALKLI